MRLGARGHRLPARAGRAAPDRPDTRAHRDLPRRPALGALRRELRDADPARPGRLRTRLAFRELAAGRGRHAARRVRQGARDHPPEGLSDGAARPRPAPARRHLRPVRFRP
ncbi:MAG: hypothetical protein ACK559_33615 [bacterium]